MSDTIPLTSLIIGLEQLGITGGGSGGRTDAEINALIVANPAVVANTAKSGESAVVFKGVFTGEATVVLWDDDLVSIRWHGMNKQMQYYPKAGWSWHDAGILFVANSSQSSRGDDISNSSNAWYYFTTDGTLNSQFSLGSYGNFAFCHITKETFSSSVPSYYIRYTGGTQGSVSAVIERVI